MKIVATLFFLIVSAQGEALSETDWPDAIQLINGDMIFAFVDEDQWKKTQMKVVLDAPWLEPRARRVSIWNRDVFDTYRENAGERERRITKGYEAAGFVNVDTKGGERWIHESEIELAERAFALESHALEGTSTADADAKAEIIGESLVASQSAPFLELWGMHIALAGVAVLLAVVVFWGFIRN